MTTARGLRRRAVVDPKWSSLELEVEEDAQHEGEERKRLDEDETQKHGCADVSRGSGVASDAFASSRSDTALAERSAKRRDGQAEANGQSKRRGIDRGLLRRSTLRERGRRDGENGDESNNQQCSFLHNFLLVESGFASTNPETR